MKTKLNTLFKSLVIFLTGGFLYIFIELLWDGSSHWAMFVLGGLSLLLIGAINNGLPWDMSIILQMLIGAVIITDLELIAGIFINQDFSVWDYRQLWGNYKGQICPLFSFFWFILSGVAIMLDDFLRYRLFGEEKPHYYIFNKKERS